MPTTPPVFSLQYAGCIDYWRALVQYESVCVDRHEFFRKQSYHNRCRIAGSTGLLILPIPTSGSHFKRPLFEMEISYHESWQRVHWNAIRSAYGSAPFFPYYDYLIEPFYTKQYRFLADFNLQLTETLLRLLQCNTQLVLSNKYQKDVETDFRDAFHAKKENAEMNTPRYAQVFETRLGFVPNLSVLDLLFNMGPRALAYLHNNNQ